jgi:hypothetical protein
VSQGGGIEALGEPAVDLSTQEKERKVNPVVLDGHASHKVRVEDLATNFGSKTPSELTLLIPGSGSGKRQLDNASAADGICATTSPALRV